MQVYDTRCLAGLAVTALSGPPRFRSPKGLYCRSLPRSLLGVLVALVAVLPIQAGSLKPQRAAPAATPEGHPLTVVNHLGESDEQAALRSGTSPARDRTLDPFGVAIRGSYKVLPPVVVERPSAAPATQSPAVPANNPTLAGKPAQAPTPNNQPTLEKAVAQLTIGGLNVTRREILIGARQVREGDLLVLELDGRRFVAWVQRIDGSGVQFCDVDLHPLVPKPFRGGPSPLPGTLEMADVRTFLDRNAP